MVSWKLIPTALHRDASDRVQLCVLFVPYAVSPVFSLPLRSRGQRFFWPTRFPGCLSHVSARMRPPHASFSLPSAPPHLISLLLSVPPRLAQNPTVFLSQRLPVRLPAPVSTHPSSHQPARSHALPPTTPPRLNRPRRDIVDRFLPLSGQHAQWEKNGRRRRGRRGTLRNGTLAPCPLGFRCGRAAHLRRVVNRVRLRTTRPAPCVISHVHCQETGRARVRALAEHIGPQAPDAEAVHHASLTRRGGLRCGRPRRAPCSYLLQRLK